MTDNTSTLKARLAKLPRTIKKAAIPVTSAICIALGITPFLENRFLAAAIFLVSVSVSVLVIDAILTWLILAILLPALKAVIAKEEINRATDNRFLESAKTIQFRLKALFIGTLLCGVPTAITIAVVGLVPAFNPIRYIAWHGVVRPIAVATMWVSSLLAQISQTSTAKVNTSQRKRASAIPTTTGAK
jgi:hypothetical protein